MLNRGAFGAKLNQGLARRLDILSISLEQARILRIAYWIRHNMGIVSGYRVMHIGVLIYEASHQRKDNKLITECFNILFRVLVHIVKISCHQPFPMSTQSLGPIYLLYVIVYNAPKLIQVSKAIFWKSSHLIMPNLTPQAILG